MYYVHFNFFLNDADICKMQFFFFFFNALSWQKMQFFTYYLTF